MTTRMLLCVLLAVLSDTVCGRLSRSAPEILNSSAVAPHDNASAAVPKNVSNAGAAKPHAAAQSMPDIGAILQNAKALQEPTVSPQAAAGANRKKLDVGLNDFEKKLEDDIAKVLLAQLPNNTNASARERFNNTVRSDFRVGFLEGVKSSKQKVAHNWLQLKPEKRENYFSAIKARFAEIFDTQEKRVSDRVKIAFFSDTDLPPKANDAQVKQNIEKLVSKIVKPLAKQCDDYAEMFYMSNIFLRFRVKMSKKVLALATEKSVIVQ